MSRDELRETYLSAAREWLQKAVEKRAEGKPEIALQFAQIARNCEWQAGRLR